MNFWVKAIHMVSVNFPCVTYVENRENCVYIKNYISNDIYLLLCIYNSNLQSILDAPIKFFYFLSLKENIIPLFISFY